MDGHQLDKVVIETRSNDYGIETLILNRWSPRAFLDKKVPDEEWRAVLDAAHWAPSSNNEQPWRFLVASQPETLKKVQACLTERNQRWANRAPILIVVLSKPVYSRDGSKNHWHSFDAGAAWGYLALEAKHRGMIAHAMAGFSREKVMEACRVPQDWGLHAVVALGYQAPADHLPEDLKKRENPSLRKPLESLWREGEFDFDR